MSAIFLMKSLEKYRISRKIHFMSFSFKDTKRHVTTAQKSAEDNGTQTRSCSRPANANPEKGGTTRNSLKAKNSNQNGSKSPKLRTCSIEVNSSNIATTKQNNKTKQQQNRHHRGDDVKKARKQVRPRILISF